MNEYTHIYGHINTHTHGYFKATTVVEADKSTPYASWKLSRLEAEFLPAQGTLRFTCKAFQMIG